MQETLQEIPHVITIASHENGASRRQTTEEIARYYSGKGKRVLIVDANNTPYIPYGDADRKGIGLIELCCQYLTYVANKTFSGDVMSEADVRTTGDYYAVDKNIDFLPLAYNKELIENFSWNDFVNNGDYGKYFFAIFMRWLRKDIPEHPTPSSYDVVLIDTQTSAGLLPRAFIPFSDACIFSVSSIKNDIVHAKMYLEKMYSRITPQSLLNLRRQEKFVLPYLNIENAKTEAWSASVIDKAAWDFFVASFDGFLPEYTMKEWLSANIEGRKVTAGALMDFLNRNIFL